MGFLRQLWNRIYNFLRDVWEDIKKAVAIIVAVIAVAVFIGLLIVMTPAIAFESTAFFVGTFKVTVAHVIMYGTVIVGASYLLMPDTTAWAVDRAFDGLTHFSGEVIEAGTEIVGDVVEGLGTVATRAAASFAPLLAIGVLVYVATKD